MINSKGTRENIVVKARIAALPKQSTCLVCLTQ
jgi:hypothetical protein